mmetsp:Transcript_32472/g.74742  ORF Transcript_32472/g.74742 Transcript_32472/m.74742 type:complete len:81 (+) Transcript_32472:302-544(+)
MYHFYMLSFSFLKKNYNMLRSTTSPHAMYYILALNKDLRIMTKVHLIGSTDPLEFIESFSTSLQIHKLWSCAIEKTIFFK